MLCVLSPAKSLNFDPANPSVPRTDPAFQADAVKLAKSAGRLSRAKLKALMALSDDLADLNYRRFRAFAAEPTGDSVKQAALAFSGDTYIGLDFQTLSSPDMAYAQDHVRILSGLYGALRPFDAIQPYRLEMGRKLKTGRADSRYAYWDTRLAGALDAAAVEAGAGFILNCASTEYFKAAREDALRTPVITPVFLDEKNGVAKTIGFFAKRARGALTRFVVENRITDPADLAGFDWQGYGFVAADSTPLAPVFFREEMLKQAS